MTPLPTHPICSACRSDARENRTLHVTFCPIHGFGARIDVVPGVARDAYVTAAIATGRAGGGA